MSKDLADILNSTIGPSDKVEGVKIWLDTGFPPLNKAVGGDYDKGMPVGRIVEMFGPESCGKTAIATNVMANAQKMGGVAFFMDHERSFVPEVGESLGLNTSSHFVVKQPDTFESSVTSVIKSATAIRDNDAIPEDAPIVVVFDSLASMLPQSKFAKDIDEQGMNDSLALAKACAAVFPTLALYAEKLNMLILVLNQEREKPGVVYGDPTTTPGGKAPKFYASVRIQIGRKKIMEQQKGGKEFVGQEIGCKVIKNKVAKPFQSAEWRFMFDENGIGYFDVVGSMIDYLSGKALIKRSGAYYEWKGKKYHRKQLIEVINENDELPELKALLPTT